VRRIHPGAARGARPRADRYTWGMNRWRAEETLWTLVPLVSLAVVLGVLVTLQVRWTWELSRAHRQDRQARLEEKLQAFARDFDREVTRLYYVFHIRDPWPGAPDPDALARTVAQRYSYWLGTAPYPQLVDRIWLLSSDAARLFRFDDGAAGFEPGFSSPEPETLRRKLADWRALTDGRRESAGCLLSVDPLAMVTVWETRAKPLSEPLAADPGELACLVVEIRSTAISEALVPDLAHRHLYRAGEPEFDFAIVGERAGDPILYRSKTDLGSSSDEYDAVAHLWRPRMEDLVLAPGPWPPAPPSAPPPPPAPTINPPGGSTGPGGRHFDPEAGEARDPREGRLQTGIGTFDPGTGLGHFRLVARHRSGSLDAVADAERRRDLTLSLGALSLLTASMVLLVLSARQARQYARRQREFLAGVSHELRTPLSVICAAAENLADGVAPKDEEGIREYGGLIRIEGRRLAGLVDDLLEFAAVSSGRKQYLMRDLDPGRIVRRALDHCRGLLGDRGIAVEVRIPEGIPYVRGEPEALGRAVRNLIGNAVTHGGDGGWVGLEVGWFSDRREVGISVSDRGVGIPRRDQRRIFLPFERGTTAVVKRIRGAGVGLSLVKHTVERHGGRVELESAPGCGARFTLFLPAVDSTCDGVDRGAGEDAAPGDAALAVDGKEREGRR
jgi:signal transduction histidine kinase